ncbi:hypothetical protein SDRG_00934 [Saprolegnia diclina VS20]|uniref:Ubiquitin-like protease family profile domain-containing protein n=1 Tax=Saprolegnia diclina (strain VS20) TaxID=1156394 RepID=T0S9W9_SAPDV|nr:hypothetical protein SDRG_00934 [Saprolegnia diclina VS20]EQC42093.1 hypothetical protein SDRG_00934 [Saprolegnia diclina VS20]|eukprot:XP_008604662.1 hypothetical protein SDRG_00934 [Saprolegnia diclina VS20]
MDLVEVEYTVEFRSKSFGLRLMAATENGSGAVLVGFTTEPRPSMRDLPPFRYQLHSLGAIALTAMPFRTIVTTLAKHDTYPVMIRFISCPMACELAFPTKHKKLNLIVEESGDRLRITEYSRPFRTQSPIPSIALGSHYIAAINGTAASTSQEATALLRTKTSFPAIVHVSIEQDEESAAIQARLLSGRATRQSSSSPPPAKRLRPSVAAPPTLPSTSIDNPIVLSDSSDAAEATPSAPVSSLLTRGQAVRSLFGVGIIHHVAYNAAAPSASIVTVHLPHGGLGYFNRESLHCVDEVPCATYIKRRAKGQVVLTYGDVGRLADGRLFNDSILDFYLSYLYDALPLTHATYICSSFLFGTFQQARKTGLDAAHAAVTRWTKAVDLFQTKYLVVPINETGHWSVAIVCNLSRFVQATVCNCSLFRPEVVCSPTICTMCHRPRDMQQERNDNVCIVMLDSLKCHRTARITKFLREYLQLEWDTTHRDVHGPLTFNQKVLPAVVPPWIPRQTNNCDCGVFVLQYVELFLRRPPRLNAEFLLAKRTKAAAASLSLVSNETVLDATWFDDAAIPAKRRQLERLVHDPRVVQLHATPLVVDRRSAFPVPPTTLAHDSADGVATASSIVEEEKSMTLRGASSKDNDAMLDVPETHGLQDDTLQDVVNGARLLVVHEKPVEMSLEPSTVPAAATANRAVSSVGALGAS